MSARTWGFGAMSGRWAVAFTVVALAAGGAYAQGNGPQMMPLKPLPTAPAAGGATQNAPAPMAPMPLPANPAPVASVPQSMTPMPSMQPLGPGGPGMGRGGPGGAQECAAEFTKLRTEAEKKGAVARAASERKASREEMCKHLTDLAAAEAKWYKFAAANSKRCGIPDNIIEQVKTGHNNLRKMQKNVCAGGGGVAAAPPPPSLSEALGTSELPTPTTDATKRGGALDTLTGAPIR